MKRKVMVFLFFIPVAFLLGGKWAGVDETVVERLAEVHGRPARKPLINTDQGDLLLFLFLISGSVAGFAAGYYWNELMRKD